ncbi:MAG: nucleotidyl transferase AbiEii/AbiGii toxin family protein, partial [Myxococcota bacterium]
SADRQLYFEQAAARRNLHVAILEKDFWVCWLLAVLFEDDVLRNAVVFKGGTSLSKVHGAIARFSEDIDLSVSPVWLGVAEEELDDKASRVTRDKWMKSLQEACTARVRTGIQPRLEASARAALGTRSGGLDWLEYLDDPATHAPVLLFHYPTQSSGGFSYLPRSVKLEFGSLTEQRPVGLHLIRPWLAEEVPQAFDDWRCEVVALDIGRSFWEKATILHAEHHRDLGTPMPSRYSRHYADTAALGRLPAVDAAVRDDDMLERVVAWKAKFFSRGWARYDLARRGTFRLVPPDARLAELTADYTAMAPMYFSGPPPFDAVLQTLTELEERINRAGERNLGRG